MIGIVDKWLLFLWREGLRRLEENSLPTSVDRIDQLPLSVSKQYHQRTDTISHVPNQTQLIATRVTDNYSLQYTHTNECSVITTSVIVFHIVKYWTQARYDSLQLITIAFPDRQDKDEYGVSVLC